MDNCQDNVPSNSLYKVQETSDFHLVSYIAISNSLRYKVRNMNFDIISIMFFFPTENSRAQIFQVMCPKEHQTSALFISSAKERSQRCDLLVVHQLQKTPFKLKCRAGPATSPIQLKPFSSLACLPVVCLSNKHFVLRPTLYGCHYSLEVY